MGFNSYGGAEQHKTVRAFTNTFNAKNDPFTMSSPLHRGMYFLSGQRRRLNCIAVLISLFIPWLLFSFVFGILSFNIHYKRPALCYLAVLLVLVCVVGASALLALNAMRKKFTDPSYQPSWYAFIAVTSVLAFLLACYAGQWNFRFHMEPYYNLESLANYTGISTGDYLGLQLMDAGRIEFKEGTVLDLSHSMGFKNHDTFCVAPIVTGGSANLANAQSVDFWAVGKNCCSGVQADFHCTGFSDPQATGVIRMMHDEDRPFYRLAVQQAEATYKITASHPLFFTWVHNAEEATNDFAYHGYRDYVIGILAHLVAQSFLVAASTLAFAKLIHA